LNGVEIACMQIEWSVRAGTLRNIDSARVSVPATVKYDDSKKWLVPLSLLFITVVE